MWEELVDRKLVGECLRGERYEDDLFDDARDLLRVGRAFARTERRRLWEENGDASDGWAGVTGRRRRRQGPTPIELNWDTKMRGVAESEVAAHLAGDWTEVRAFREEVLGGRLLSPEEAADFYESDDFRSSQRRWRRLVARLVERFGWEERRALDFLVSGNTPLQLPVWIVEERQAYSYGPAPPRINLTAAPWVPAAEVEKAFRAQQRRMLEGNNRPTKLRTLLVFLFVWRHETSPQGLPSWPTLFSEWNRAHEDDEELRHPDIRNFRRDYLRTKEAILKRLKGEPTG